MTRLELDTLLRDIAHTRIAVIGDYCLDSYWFVDETAAEPSLETGLKTRPVRRQRYTLGGAGNVAMNLVALGVGRVSAFGVVGDDPFGRELARLLRAARVATDGLLTQPADWDTLVYAKPYVGDAEQPRFDFGNFNRLSDATAARLTDALATALADTDVTIVNEQVAGGLHGAAFFRERLGALLERHAERCFVLDSRHHCAAYPTALRKLNAHEAAQLCGIPRRPDERVLREEARRAATLLYDRWRRPVFVTRGERGCLVHDATGLHEVPGLQILGRTDPVGAGDSLLAGLAAALATGRDPLTAATLGNFAAGVTVQKLFQTGTATPEEVRAIGGEPTYVYRPELAEDPRQARYADDAEIEIVARARPAARVTHLIFDHDGTLSTLRQGWEQIMEPMMIRAVLGPRFQDADESLYARVVRHVRDYIDRTTGVQTLAQMEGLTELVRAFGCVPEADILTAAGYKRRYNDALMTVVRARIAKFHRGELAVEDYTLKNAAPFLHALRRAGVALYLASGTDTTDVRQEAEALGYADVFAGHIYGADDGEPREAKKRVLTRLLAEIGHDRAVHLAVCGDGPVEIRETLRHGGFAIGVASDEVRRFGLNPDKRARLIRAGADWIIPDYSQMDRLLAILTAAPGGCDPTGASG